MSGVLLSIAGGNVICYCASNIRDERFAPFSMLMVVNQGLRFDRDWYGINSLPLNSSDYGPKKFHHLFMGNDIPANIALFYRSTDTRHRGEDTPAGYVYGQSTPSIRTQNWFYYYNQEVTPPCTVRYSTYPDPPSSKTYGYYNDPDSHINLCNAHGQKTTLLFRIIGGLLTVVGKEDVRGINTYARVIQHENAHKRCYDYLRRPGIDLNVADWDRDGVPDEWEKIVKMQVKKITDSTNFLPNWPNTVYTTWQQAERETFARLYEEGVFVHPDYDWADDGMNWGLPAAPNRCSVSVVMAMDDTLVTSLPGTVPVKP